MIKINAQTMPLYAGGAVALLALLWLVKRGVGGVASDVAHGAVSVAGGVIGGTVVGLGEQVGLPATSPAQCAIDTAAGNTWDASFSCSAGDFIGSLFGEPVP